MSYEGYSAVESDGSKQLRLAGHFGTYTGVTVVASGATANFTGSNLGDAAAVMFSPSSGEDRGTAVVTFSDGTQATLAQLHPASSSLYEFGLKKIVNTGTGIVTTFKQQAGNNLNG
tara:strand:+ start:629 stop:976 length:348 start_codon:yes stop_codon:yes gene_type:complete